MQLSEERRSQKREVIMKHLEKEREDLKKMNEMYDQKVISIIWLSDFKEKQSKSRKENQCSDYE